MSSLTLGQRPIEKVRPENCKCTCHSRGCDHHCQCCECGGQLYHEFLTKEFDEQKQETVYKRIENEDFSDELN